MLRVVSVLLPKQLKHSQNTELCILLLSDWDKCCKNSKLFFCNFVGHPRIPSREQTKHFTENPFWYNGIILMLRNISSVHLRRSAGWCFSSAQCIISTYVTVVTTALHVCTSLPISAPPPFITVLKHCCPYHTCQHLWLTLTNIFVWIKGNVAMEATGWHHSALAFYSPVVIVSSGAPGATF